MALFLALLATPPETCVCIDGELSDASLILNYCHTWDNSQTPWCFVDKNSACEGAENYAYKSQRKVTCILPSSGSSCPDLFKEHTIVALPYEMKSETHIFSHDANIASLFDYLTPDKVYTLTAVLTTDCWKTRSYGIQFGKGKDDYSFQFELESRAQKKEVVIRDIWRSDFIEENWQNIGRVKVPHCQTVLESISIRQADSDSPCKDVSNFFFDIFTL